MQEDKYYIEIDSLIKRNEINKKRRIRENYDTLNNYWHIGKLLVTQGGELKAQYGNALIKKWRLNLLKTMVKDIMNLI